MTTTITTQILDDGLAIISLNRPNKYNAFNSEMIQTLQAALLTAEENPNVRILLLNAVGKHFSAGADLAWLQSTIDYSESDNQADAKQLAELLYRLAHCKKPIVCAVQGRSYGGALGLIACSDIVIASDVASFCFSEVKLGIIPATIAPYVLRKIQLSEALHLMLSAEPFEVEIAQKLGLVHHIRPAARLQAETLAYCQTLLKNGPTAMMAVKQLLNTLHPISSETIEETSALLAKIRVSPEGQEGLKAFFEKRPPAWQLTLTERKNHV